MILLDRMNFEFQVVNFLALLYHIPNEFLALIDELFNIWSDEYFLLYDGSFLTCPTHICIVELLSLRNILGFFHKKFDF